MAIKLSALEARVVGALIEKEITTPEVYPMTLNGLTTACNQKSNREPVLSLSEAEVQTTLDTLQSKHLVMKISGQRSLKFKQRLCNTEFSAYQFTEQQRAVVCLLLLRGAQTAGELRSRSGRLADFEDVKAVDLVLQALEQHEKGKLVQSLPKVPGKREIRYVCLLLADIPVQMDTTSDVAPQALVPGTVGRPAESSTDTVMVDAKRLALLEERVQRLEEKLQILIGPDSD